MWVLPQQLFPFPQRLPDLSQITVLEIPQPAMDDSRRAAGRPRGKVVLLQQQRAPTPVSAFPCDGDAIDPATDHDDIKALIVERRPEIRVCNHQSSVAHLARLTKDDISFWRLAFRSVISVSSVVSASAAPSIARTRPPHLK